MNILIAIDFSQVTPDLLAAAGQLRPGKLWLLHVAEPEPAFMGFEGGPDAVRDMMAERYHREHKDLQALADKLRANGVDVTALLIQGPTVETIVAQAEKLEADVIVAGTHGHGIVRDVLLGNVSAGLVRAARRPLLLVPVAP